MVQMSILIYNWRDIKNPDAGGAEVFTQIRDGATGLVCKPNPVAMAERVIEILQGNMLWERLSKDALAWAGEDWERRAE